MTQLVPVSRERHADKRWRRHASYAFAARSAVVALVAAELPKAAMNLPIGFAREAGGFAPVALLGLQPDINLFVASDGRWAGGYIPAALRGYPFQLLRREDEQLLLCIDADSGLVGVGSDGEAFFDETGEPAQAIRQILDFLQQIERNRQVTRAACATLEQAGLLQPWPVAARRQDDAPSEPARQIEGLFRVNETTLNALDAATLVAVRDAGGLGMAYCQMLAMQHLPLLGRLADAQSLQHRALARRAADYFGQDDAYEFDWGG